ncbi:MAG: SRPBCC family protein [Polyangiales bacterium]
MSRIKHYRHVSIDEIHSTPFSYSAEIEIPCSADHLFDVFEDAHAWTVWADAIKKVQWTSDKPFGVGTTRTVWLHGGRVGYEEFIEWKRGERMAFVFTKGNLPVSFFAEDYAVKSLGSDRCRVRWTMALGPTGPGKLALRLLAPVFPMLLKKC